VILASRYCTHFVVTIRHWTYLLVIFIGTCIELNTGLSGGDADVEPALLPPAFLPAQRRQRSHTLVHHPPPPLSPSSLQQPHTPGRRTLASLNTPPPRASNVSRLKLKGSFTDPAYPRRRPPFGQVRYPIVVIEHGLRAVHQFRHLTTFSISMKTSTPPTLHLSRPRNL